MDDETVHTRRWVLTDKALAALDKPDCTGCGAARVPLLNLPMREDVEREGSQP